MGSFGRIAKLGLVSDSGSHSSLILVIVQRFVYPIAQTQEEDKVSTRLPLLNKHVFLVSVVLGQPRSQRSTALKQMEIIHYFH